MKINYAQNLTIEDLTKRSLLEKFVQYLSSETINFLDQKKRAQNYILDIYLSSLNEDLLEFFERKINEFCRSIIALKPEVNYGEI